ncbi:hypothetical protein MRX96_012781 [Rhipicephalus microplus]
MQRASATGKLLPSLLELGAKLRRNGATSRLMPEARRRGGSCREGGGGRRAASGEREGHRRRHTRKKKVVRRPRRPAILSPNVPAGLARGVPCAPLGCCLYTDRLDRLRRNVSLAERRAAPPPPQSQKRARGTSRRLPATPRRSRLLLLLQFTCRARPSSRAHRSERPAGSSSTYA